MKHNVPMRIFISSVRRGLELERDALPGLIKALGHEPVRFEDFSAQSVPSREACINGVESSDAYLLLLGPHYGTVFPETGQSATHDEWVAAQRVGIPRFVFRKSGSTFDLEQQEFERSLGDYGSGRFYKAFSDIAELQQAVVASIRELEASPESMDFEPLHESVAIRWLGEEAARNQFSSSERSPLEIHVVPLDGSPVSARLLEQIGTGLPKHVRNAGLVSAAQGLELDHIEGGVVVQSPPPLRRGGFHETHEGSFAAVMVRKSGGTTVTFRLPGDTMGSILDARQLAQDIASALRLSGRIDVTGAARFAIGMGITSTSMVAVGELGRGPRNSVGMRLNSSPLRLEPDETVSRAALDRGGGRNRVYARPVVDPRI
ncbi:DUF4062 domain-containing protein [Pseudarthrobacter sulfonivorans]|uniref:DUF4062 domain-containing protein n=1 Tax=Pseudarthrobacter sulfonivorans TaxID=121292 RepID=UPI0027D83CFA|nr:DUF4062 domain-containing protein [Pseudarthrobacter sulfonivorans]